MRRTIFRCFLILGLGGIGSLVDCNHEFSQPNILFIITDDQSWKHLSCYGDPVVRTPTIDSLAQAGLRFQHAYTAAPSCSPSRAGILTGQDIYRLEEGGVLTGFIRDKFVVFPSLLENAGYAVGGTGKKYWPKTKDVPNAHNLPVGKTYSKIRLEKVPEGISKTDYAENFRVFLTQNQSSKPFFFWVGISEPHIPHPKGLGVKKGINPERINVPSFYPNIPLVRSALADYLYEIEWADQSIAKVLQVLVANGYQNNTLVVFTSDNGMPFPRAKATLYDWGVRMPLIMAWGDQIHNRRIINAPVSLIDLAPTFLELAGADIPGQMTGKSLVDIMLNGASEKLDSHRNFVVTAIEKHTHARRDSLGFPRRAIHTQEWTYIINYEPDRWPAGDSAVFIPNWDFYGDIDPTDIKKYMVSHKYDEDVLSLFKLCFGKVVAEELYHKASDPDMTNNLSDVQRHQEIKLELKDRLNQYLIQTKDPRMEGKAPWDHYYLDF